LGEDGIMSEWYWSEKERELRRLAVELKTKYGCTAVKLGTEVEANSFEEVDYLNKLMNGILPIVVKIGGPEARNDIRELYRLRVGGLIAPMVESPYGLKKYVGALRDIIDPEARQAMIKGINAETVNCYNRFDEMLATPEAKELNQVTIGRGDLSESVGKKVDDPEVMKMTFDITRKAQKAGLLVSVGGGITPVNARRIADEIRSDKINSRHVVISVKESPDVAVSFRKALEFENAVMENDVLGLNKRLSALQKRMDTLKKRLAAT